MAMVEIDAGTFARNALRVHAEGRMGFQSEADRRTGACRYVYPSGCRCAIGAGMPAEAAEEIQNKLDQDDALGSSVNGIIGEGFLRVTSAVLDDNELTAKLRIIQVRHDNIMSHSSPFNAKGQEAQMLDLLNLLSRLHPETPAQET